ncbi:MAG: universal stress protein [Candidatus Hydrothermarchaeales archaeon]
MRILICTDGSKQAEDAIRFGYPIAKGLGSEVTILGVAERPRNIAGVEESLKQAEDLLTDLKIETKMREGYADEEIVKESEEGYDLIIIGAIGRRGLKRFLLGQTAVKILKYARISVLVVRGKPSAVSNIMICTGGGERGEEDIKFGGRIAKATGADVNILHCVSQIPMVDIQEKEKQVLSTSLEEETRETKHLKKGLAILKQLGVTGEAKLRYGLVEDEIFAEASAGNYDLLVVGAHATWGLGRYLLGDVTSRIIDHAEVPVLVVKSPKHII